MATNEQTMAWMMDTYSMLKGYAVPEIVTGKPISIGGSVFRHEATGAGVVMVIERACARLGWDLAEQRCIVQGFGNVGGIAASELHERGARVVGVSDLSGGVYSEAGLDVPALHAFVDRARVARRLRAGVERVTNDLLLELPCDILVLAAREDQVTGANAGNLHCKLVAEGANGPTSIDGDRILAERGIPVLPDILTNAGGVTVSYFEWVQDLGRLFWDRDEIRRRLADKLSDAFDRVWDRLARPRDLAARRGARRGDPRSVRCARSARDLSMTTAQVARDAMVPEPFTLDVSATASEAGEVLSRDAVRAVLVTEDGRLVGVVTRKTLVREVVAAGRTPGETRSARSPRSRMRRSIPRCRSTRRSRSSSSRTTSACRSSRARSCSACSRARPSSAAWPRTSRRESTPKVLTPFASGGERGGDLRDERLQRVAEALPDLVVDEPAVVVELLVPRGRRTARPR